MRTFIYLGLLSIATAFIPQDASKREIPAMLAGSMPIRREPEFSTSDSKPLKKRASPYLNPKTEKFAVDGSALPDVMFDIGESYAGLLPISSAANETRELFFWFFPSENPAASDEVTIWLNGGPGCSSLNGLLQENGPFLWQAGTFLPVKNPYTWSNLTNMIYIEQPIGVGFTQGKPDIDDEVELGQQFIGFWKNFFDAFELQGRKTYVTGESYGGYYVPYIADAFINADDTKYYNLAGTLIIDPIIGDGTLQQEVPIAALVHNWENEFNLNVSFMATMDQAAETCGYTTYLNEFLTFPPPGPFADPPSDLSTNCRLFRNVERAALRVNPCFNIYHLTDQCPFLWSVLGVIANGFQPPGAAVYFNRSDVQAAINAPPTNWDVCVDGVFTGGGDHSYGPAQDGVLQHVIEFTNNTIIMNGMQDYILPTNGTLLAVQNMTWNGLQGLQTPPSKDFFVPYHVDYNLGAVSGAGIAGSWVTDRGFTFATVTLSGHMVPAYAPGAAYRMMEFLLGRISSPSQMGSFTTQGGNATQASVLKRRQ